MSKILHIFKKIFVAWPESSSPSLSCVYSRENFISGRRRSNTTEFALLLPLSGRYILFPLLSWTFLILRVVHGETLSVIVSGGLANPTSGGSFFR